MTEIETLADDTLRGCPAIGAFLGLSARSVLWALEQQRIPAWREGATWCASKAALRRHYAERASKFHDPEVLRAERAARAAKRRASRAERAAPVPRRRKVALPASGAKPGKGDAAAVEG